MVDTPYTPFTPFGKHTPRAALGDISNRKLLFSAIKTPAMSQINDIEERNIGQAYLNLEEIQEITKESLGIILESPIDSPRMSMIPDTIIEIDESEMFEDMDFEIIQAEIDRFLDTKPNLYPSFID